MSSEKQIEQFKLKLKELGQTEILALEDTNKAYDENFPEVETKLK